MKKLDTGYRFTVSGSDVWRSEPIDMGFIWNWSYVAQIEKLSGTIAGEINSYVANDPDGPWVTCSTGSYGDAAAHLFRSHGDMFFGWVQMEVSGSTGEVEVEIDVFGKGF